MKFCFCSREIFFRDSISVPTASSDRFSRHAHAGLQIEARLYDSKSCNAHRTQNIENNVRERWMGGSLRSFSHKDDFRFYSRPNASRQAKCVLRSFALAWNKNFYFLIESGKSFLWFLIDTSRTHNGKCRCRSNWKKCFILIERW